MQTGSQQKNFHSHKENEPDKAAEETQEPHRACGEPKGSDPEVDSMLSQEEEAQELIEKYKLPGGPVRLHPSLVGFDTSNRDGIPMSGSRCDELLQIIAKAGWNAEEADFGNIAVQACTVAKIGGL